MRSSRIAATPHPRWRIRRGFPLGSRLLLLLGVAYPGALTGQTVRPVIVEAVNEAEGRLELVNPTLFPLRVVIEPRSFSVSEDGEPSFRPLDPQVRIKLSQMSLRIPPMQSAFVFYEAEADTLPVWFTIYATFAGFPQEQGLNVQVELPHTVYLQSKEPFRKTHIAIRQATFHPDEERVTVVVENTGPRVGRVLSADVRGGGEMRSLGPFPLLPRSPRRLEIPWKAPEAPQVIRLMLDSFEAEALITTPSVSDPPLSDQHGTHGTPEL